MANTITIDGMEFETMRVRPGMFAFRVRLPGGMWVHGREPIHGQASSKAARKALAHYGRLDLCRAGIVRAG